MKVGLCFHLNSVHTIDNVITLKITKKCNLDNVVTLDHFLIYDYDITQNDNFAMFIISVHLSENIGQLCLSPEYSDVTLVVENQRIRAHKVILASRSEYFRALLFGGMRETSQV